MHHKLPNTLKHFKDTATARKQQFPTLVPVAGTLCCPKVLTATVTSAVRLCKAITTKQGFGLQNLFHDVRC
jgi:hypothetical protein